jgi:phosphoglycerate dehydrogenase-like enzyme
MKAVLPTFTRQLVEQHLPTELDVVWWSAPAEAAQAIPSVDIAWIDMQPASLVAETLEAAGSKLRWLNTIYTGLDALPLEQLYSLGVTVTNGAGINAVAVAEYAVLGVLAAAKRFDQVLGFAERREWTNDAPGKLELFESHALILGMGTIGSLIARRLEAFGVNVTGVTRTGRNGTLTPDKWQARLGEQDWVIIAAPLTDSTRAMIGSAQLAAMKPGAWLINVARGAMVDQEALVAALEKRRIGGAFLDTVQPEPLPPEHPLWVAPNALISMHLSGRSTTRMIERAATLFLENLTAFLADKPLYNVVDLKNGY